MGLNILSIQGLTRLNATVAAVHDNWLSDYPVAFSLVVQGHDLHQDQRLKNSSQRQDHDLLQSSQGCKKPLSSESQLAQIDGHVPRHQQSLENVWRTVAVG